ncbi:MAG: molybdopterin molybdenumtransferase MoeA [Frankiales bacterium]|nr:molybdopterin molybdenumtransferase MoeA [Frankiales bacterium]
MSAWGHGVLDEHVGAVAAMDGIAVRAGDTDRLRLGPRLFDVIDTGDPMPSGRDAVVVREQVKRDGADVLIEHPVAPGRHVRQRGEDLVTGDLLLAAGTMLRPLDVAAAGAGGHTHLPVRRRPRVVVIPTGDEIRPLGSPTAAGEVLDTNSLMLIAQAVAAGATASAVDIVPDDPGALTAAVQQAVTTADLVVIGAGSSAGRDDHTAAVVAALGTVVVHGVAVRPGHPVLLGVVAGVPVLGSPGYPVSAWLTFELLAVPLLAALLGTAPPRRTRVRAPLAVDVDSPAGLDDWVRVALVDGRAMPLPGGAGSLGQLAAAEGLLLVPAGVTGHSAGDPVEIVLLRPT